MPDTTCIQTRVKNISGSSKFFGFLPPHGQTVADTADVLIDGDLVDTLMRGGRQNKRKIAALKDALTNNYIEIIKSPGLFLYDSALTVVKTVKINNGTLSGEDPCYGSYTGNS